MTRVIHAITPGDHYSPRTGSAIPSVVHGLATAALADTGEGNQRFPQFVLLAGGTYQPRYDSATPIEYRAVAAPTRNQRILDVAMGALGGRRRSAIRYWQPLVDALVGEEPAIILAHNAPMLPWMLRNSRHRVVLYAHNDILRTMSRRESARLLRTVQSIVCVSASLAAEIAGHLPAAFADRIAVVGNGVDCAQFTPAAGRHQGRLRLVFVGRMIPQKGPDVLLNAAALLRRDDLEVLLVGSHGFDPDAPLTEYERELRRLAGKCRVPIEFRSFVARAELPDVFRSADVMVVPSRWQEPSGLTVGEALASGLPVIAHRVGGIPEVVGEAAILIERDRPALLARELERLADDAPLRERMAVDARRQAESHDWSWSWTSLRTVLSRIPMAAELAR